MAKTLRTVGMIAGAVALTATGIGAFAGAAFAASAAGATVAAVATYAGLAAGAATLGATVLQKAPPARGTVTQLIIAPDVPQPYLMGEGYYAGVLRHDAAYGGTVDDVPNPYRGMVVVYSGGGPIESISPRVDKVAITSWYTGFLYTSTALGAVPEASALTPNWAGLPGWGASSKLSGQAAIMWNLKFDKKGKRFASGVPQIGAYGKWVKAYDPRLDDTFPGGSGPHRLGNEATYTWTENPALHFGTYAYGRYQNGKRTIGCGLRSIDWGVIAAWANVCDANEWRLFGVVYEPGNRWENLKDIAAAGGGVPVISSGGLLSVKYWAPQIPLDTITADDLADGQVSYSPLQSWDDRVNTVIPRYTSADHEWNQVAAEPVSIASFVTEDGEEKRKEWPYNLVKNAEQAAQLAAYQIYEGREINPIVIPCLPRLRAYRPGECLTLDLPDYGLEGSAIILQRTLDPSTMTVTLTMIGETPGKHAVALGQTPAPPAIPVAGQSGEDRDETTSGAGSSAPIEVADQAAMLALNTPPGSLRVGTLVKITSTGEVYSYNGGTAGTIADWTLVATTTNTLDWGDIGGTLTDQADLVAALAAKQPVDADLTAIAALATTSYGRSLLTLADGAALTAEADEFTSTLKGLAPASGGGTANFLRADGTWTVPSGGPAVVPDTVFDAAEGTGAIVAGGFSQATVSVIGCSHSILNLTGVAYSSTNLFQKQRQVMVGQATANNVGIVRTDPVIVPALGARFGGRFGVRVAGANMRILAGLSSHAAPWAGTTDPSGATNLLGFAKDSADSNLQLMHNDGSGACTKIDLGANFPANTSAIDLYEYEFSTADGASWSYEITRLNTGDTASGTLSTNLPAANAAYYIFHVGATGATATLCAISHMYLWFRQGDAT